MVQSKGWNTGNSTGKHLIWGVLGPLQNWGNDDWLPFHLPAYTEAHHRISLWGITYFKRLHAWLSLLKWPDAEQENDPGITWFEMLLNFRVVTQSTVSVNLGTAQRPIHALPEQSEVARLTPKSWKRELYSFEASLRTLRLILNGPIFPCEPMRLCRSLQWRGYQDARPGLSRRLKCRTRGSWRTDARREHLAAWRK